MKYSIRGSLGLSDGTSVTDLINQYTLWRLITEQTVDEEQNPIFTFEVWLNDVGDKDLLFDQLKPYVDENGGEISWHECTHDEAVVKPCVLSVIYQKA